MQIENVTQLFKKDKMHENRLSRPPENHTYAGQAHQPFVKTADLPVPFMPG